MKDATPPITTRVVGTLMAAALVAYFGGPVLGPTVAVLLVAVTIALIVATRKVSPRRIAGAYLWYGLLVNIICVIGLPQLWPAFCLAGASTITAGILGTRSRSGLLIGLGGGVALSAVGWFHQVDHWLAITVALLLIPFIAFTTSGILEVVKGQEERALDQLTRSSQAIIWEADADTAEMRTVAGAVQALTGYSPGEWAGLKWDQLVHPDDRDGFRCFGREPWNGVARDEAGPVQRWEGRIRTSVGGWLYVRETFRVHIDHDGQAVARGITLDIHELHAVNELATHKATHDALTGLPNRSHLMTLAGEMLRRRGSDDLVLIVVDMNRFAEVNETLGHATGDRFLMALANRFARFQEEGMVVARVNSDQFAFMARCRSEQDAVALTERILALCGDEVALGDTSLRLAASAGIAVARDDERDVIDMVRRVDSALHSAKKLKKPWQLAGSLDLGKARRRLSLATQVPEAIRTNQLELWYQPKHRLVSGAVIGFEGLIRWRHPEHGILTPSEFLDVIEMSGQAHAFDRHVIESAIRFAADCYRVAPEVRIAVNVPGRALRSEQIVAAVADELRAWRLPARALVVELTEDAISEDLETVSPALRGLADLGCRISIDDFGTGDSSLIRLRQFPVEELKIDRSFVSGLTSNPSDAAIVQWILELAQALDLNCVAEGIETQAELDHLIDHGCPDGQGYLFSKPLPPAEAFRYLTDAIAGAGVASVGGEAAVVPAASIGSAVES